MMALDRPFRGDDGGMTNTVSGVGVTVSSGGVAVATRVRFGRGEGGGGSVIKLIAVGGSGIELDADGCLFFDLFAIVLVNVRARRSPIFDSDESSDDRRASSLVRATGAGATSELNASDMIGQEWMNVNGSGWRGECNCERVMAGWIFLEMRHISTCSVIVENLLSRQNIRKVHSAPI